MSLDAIITGVTPLQAVELVCIVYGADYLHVPGVCHRRSRATITLPTVSTKRRWLTLPAVRDDERAFSVGVGSDQPPAKAAEVAVPE